MKRSLAIALIAPLLTVPATASAALKTLPLQHGYYVNADTPCGAASAATVALVRRAGIGNEQGFDRFKRVEKIGPAAYRVTADRINSDGGVDGGSVSEYAITGSSSFRQKNEFGVFAMRLCPQKSLPGPWRANNIEALIR
jgi:hypothetical protein